LLEVALRWSSVPLSSFTMVGLGGVAAWGRIGGSGLRARAGRRRHKASSAGSMKFMHILILKMAWWFDGGDDYCSVYIRCSLSVC
jgi:hypothetical protein